MARGNLWDHKESDTTERLNNNSKSQIVFSLLFIISPEPRVPATLTLGAETSWIGSSAWSLLEGASSVYFFILPFVPIIIAISLHVTIIPGVGVPVYIHLELNQTVFKILGSLTEIVI